MADFELPPIHPRQDEQQEPPKFEVPTVEESPNLPRMWPVWIVLFSLFAFIIFSSLSSKADQTSKKSAKESSKSTKQKSEDWTLEMKMAMSGMQKDAPGRLDANLFKDEIDKLQLDAKTKPEAQRMRVVLRYEDRKKPFGDDLKNLVASKSSSDRAFANLYLGENLDKKSAETFLGQLDKKDMASKIADVQIREKLGDKKIRSKVFDPSKYSAFFVFGFGICFGSMLGLTMWGLYWNQRSTRKWFPLGMPLQNISLAEADRLAALVVLVFAGYILGGLIPVPGANFILIAALLVAFLWLKPFGLNVSPSRIGLTIKPLAPKFGWAVGAYLANIPVLIVVGVITSIVFGGITGSHPAGEELMRNPTLPRVLLILFMGSIVAPIWEEIVFRGFLFPAITKLTGQPIVGALASSFLFAAIHPQGVVGIPLLMTIGCMLCAVSYQTKSLVPSILLHAINNFCTLLLALNLGRMLG